MAPVISRGRRRQLSCFYCGKRTAMQYDGSISQFTCPSCDAMNHLDENGEITDPPISIAMASQAKRFATPLAAVTSQVSSAPTESDAFCATCLKNQTLMAASLAQYYPDDPDDPNFAALERRYFAFRRSLEERYPQVCASCEPRVAARLQQARYTAKTDFLRRMMERSKEARKAPRLWTGLDVVTTGARWIWWAGLVLQLLWHMAMIVDAGLPPAYPKAGWARVSWTLIAQICHVAVRSAGSRDKLITLGIWAGIASSWWNPHFVQAWRGFSRHLLGFPQWYTFQALIVTSRVIVRMSGTQPGSWTRPSTFTTLHVFAALLACLMYTLARRAIRLDVRPLFANLPNSSHQPIGVTEHPPPDFSLRSQGPSRHPENKIGRESRIGTHAGHTMSSTIGAAGSILSASATSEWSSSNIVMQLPRTPVMTMSQPDDMIEAMDWSPVKTSSRLPRALSNSGSDTQLGRPFGQAPMDANAGPFWFKVPPAPIGPARRLQNPPAPRIIPGVQSGDVSRFRGDGSSLPVDTADVVEFRDSTFFPPSSANDPANTLADILGQRFSLGEEDRSFRMGNQAGGPISTHSSNRARAWAAGEAAVLAAVQVAWLDGRYSTEAVAVAISIAGWAVIRRRRVVAAAVGLAEALAGAYVFGQVWPQADGRAEVRWAGSGVLTFMVAYRLWEAAVPQ